MYNGDYIPPTLTVDSVVFQLIDDILQVLLIERNDEPFKGAWALPGGYNAAGQTTMEAMARVLLLKAGLDVSDLDLVEQLYTFDTIARDPRGHAVSVTYMGLCKQLQLHKTETSQNPTFFPIHALPDLAYDHHVIVEYALQRLQSKLSYTNAVFALLPRTFTLSQLQTAYQAVLGRTLDKRNFRKKYLALDLLADTEEFHHDGAHRPAHLYRFKQYSLQSLDRSFD